MFSRSALRVARVAAPSTSRVARATFSAGAKLRNAEFVGEKEVPAVSYVGGEAQRSTLFVDKSHTHTDKKNADVASVVPLSQEVYQSMTPSLQKMTIKGKTVIVTGYVLESLRVPFTWKKSLLIFPS
jgi:hypothetical protein